jgi:phosphatidylserine/phosphatidylglycerophosphate/cardiolipin synthase-like enzyme
MGSSFVKLLVQPGDSLLPLVDAIDSAKSTVEILIFRFNRREIEVALENAAKRGVSVHALIAYTNRGGEKGLRDLEMRFLESGITVSRTSNDLVRYHGKLLIIDRRVLHVYGFNLTYVDIEHSRSFGYITKDRRLVQEAVKLFEADAKRQSYTAGLADFVVSPANARKQLSAFLKAARKELLIYDPKISDQTMIRILQERAASGVDIRIIGRITRKNSKFAVIQLRKIRLHTRTIIRDRTHAFIGSQSLRKAELEERREVGVIFRDSKSVARLLKTFEDDWASSKDQATSDVKEPAAKAAKKVAKAVAKELPPMGPVLEQVVKEVVGAKGIELDAVKVEETMKDAVKKAVKEVVKDAVQEVVEQQEVMDSK